MSLPRPRVLAIGIDAAEPALVKKLMDQAELPSLKALRARGCWGEARPPAATGSGAGWPTFMTGEGPAVHGVYSVLPWDPRTMNLVRLTTDHLTPFWRGLSDAGYAVGVLDVPFAPVIGLAGGAEISEWGAHDRVRGRMLVSPPGVGRPRGWVFLPPGCGRREAFLPFSIPWSGASGWLRAARGGRAPGPRGGGGAGRWRGESWPLPCPRSARGSP